MSKLFKSLAFGLLVLIMIGCSKENNSISLDQNYLQVADVVEYCQGSCNETADWEQSKTLVKGYLRDVGNDSVWQDNQEKRRFYLLDIRNGFSLEVRVDGDEDLIFSRLAGTVKSDLIFISGIANAVIAQEGSDCTKGVVLLVKNDKDIIINLE